MGDAFSFQTVPIELNNGNLSFFQIAGNYEREKQFSKSFDTLIRNLNNFGQAGWTYEMFIEANKELGKDKVIIVFQVPANCQ